MLLRLNRTESVSCGLSLERLNAATSATFPVAADWDAVHSRWKSPRDAANTTATNVTEKSTQNCTANDPGWRPI